MIPLSSGSTQYMNGSFIESDIENTLSYPFKIISGDKNIILQFFHPVSSNDPLIKSSLDIISF